MKVLYKLLMACSGLLSFLTGSATAYATCSQTIVVPVAPAGRFVMIDDKQQITGVYPNLLRKSSGKTGCTFSFVIVPRARLDLMYKQGTGHLIIPESQTPERDLLGEFVSLYTSTPVIISARPELDIHSIADIKKYRWLRVDVVKSYDWGYAYRKAVNDLKDLGMLSEVTEAATIARKMEIGRTDITIMSAHILYGNILNLGLTDSLGKKIRFIRSPDFEAIPSGAYLSRTLPESDRKALKSMLNHWLDSGQLWKELQAAMPEEGLISLAPLDKSHRPLIHRRATVPP